MSLDSASEYALSFSEDAVHLQRRERSADEAAPHAVPLPGAWRHLGSVDFDSTAFAEEFNHLRSMAQAEDEAARASGDMLPVTLLIPDDQILYTTLTVAPGADREKAVARALDGLTPYAIEDLAFDWEGDGDSVRVAAVARQTLREAAEFARQYGFDGQAFRALPRDDSFAGEPVFALAPMPRTRPEVDPARVSVTSAALMIEPDPQEPSEDEPQAELDLDLSADSQGPAAKVAEVEVPAETAEVEVVAAEVVAAEPSVAEPETVAEVAAGDEPVEVATAEVATAEVAENEAGATDTAVSITADEPVAEPVKDATGDAEPAETASPIAAEAESAPSPEPAEKAPPVVRHAPARPAAAKPDAGKPEPVMTRADMNPRARAVHERAAEARQIRPAGTAPGTGRRPGERGGLLELVAMLGALVVGLILIWAFLVPDHEIVQAPETPVTTVAETPVAPAEEAVEETAGQGAAPVETAAAPEAAAQPVPAPVAAAPVETVVEPAPTSAPVETAAAVPAPAQAPEMASALTEQERRRVLVAAAAVAAAVVPPSMRPAAPETVAPETAATEAATSENTEEPAELASTETPTPTSPEAAAQALIAATAPAARPMRAAPAAPATEPVTASRPATQRAAVEAALRAAVESTAVTPARLTSSARPQLAPRRTTPQTSTPSADAAPRVPTNPLPFEATQRRVQPASSARPPERARRAAPAPTATTTRPASTAATETPSATASNSAAPRLRGSARPPGRPEGSAPDLIEDEGARLTPTETHHLDGLRRALDQAQTQAIGQLPPDSLLAQARPQRKPGSAAQGAATASDAVSASAIDAAVRSATGSPPDKPQRDAAAAPARDSGGLLRSSARPNRRPGAGGGAAAVGLSDSAVEAAIAAAVEASPATPGGVQLSALASSPLPPRRGGAVASAVAAASAATPDLPDAAASADPSGPSAAEMAQRRKLDEQLQSQAEARVRARAQADARAEAQARAQAEARARAQAEAEERAALASRQKYKPPEVDDEPEIEAAALSQGVTSASVGKSATQKRGINPGRTTIIGIIGAGKASRALIRLRNGKIVTVRLGDRIDGGTINSIGDGRITYVKSGRTHELRMLDGR